MRTRLHVPLAIILLALGGCATDSATTKQSPLLFVSTNSFGVDIGASPTNAGLPTVNLGFKSLDVAVVPVTTEGTTIAAIRGCYNAGVNVGKIGTCEPTDVAATVDTTASASAGESVTRVAQAAPLAPNVRTFALPVTLERPAAAPVGDLKAGAIPATLRTGGSFDQSMRDSLSVFSSFNADTKVGQEASIQLGKAFATGVAAQQLTEGFNYYLQFKGLALIGAENKEIAMRSECLQAVIDAKDKNVPDASLPNCGEKGLSLEGLRIRTACAQVLKTATEKKVPAAQLPKCSG